MAQPTPTTPPICKRCGRFLRAEEELRYGYCRHCPIPAGELPAAGDDDRFCCGSDPPCPSCPYVVGWDE